MMFVRLYLCGWVIVCYFGRLVCLTSVLFFVAIVLVCLISVLFFVKSLPCHGPFSQQSELESLLFMLFLSLSLFCSCSHSRWNYDGVIPPP